MKKIIFINQDIDQCKLISDQEIIIDKLDILIDQIEDKSKLLIILSKKCCYSDVLKIPEKNKYLFKKNADQIIKQDFNLSNNDLIIINQENNKLLPFFIINEDLIYKIFNTLKDYGLQNSSLYFETSLMKSENSKWKLLIKDNNEINIYYGTSLFVSNTSNLNNDINVLFSQNNTPSNIDFFSLNNDELNEKNRDLVNSKSELNINYYNIFKDQSCLDHKNSISISKLLKKHKSNKISFFNNWKSINIFIFSVLCFLSSFNYNQSLNNSIQQLELRSKNLVDFIFQEEMGSFDKNDLSIVSKLIENSQKLPKVNHIHTLNKIGNIFSIPGVEIDQLSIKDNDSIFIKIKSTNKTALPRINESLQLNQRFSSEILSIKNLSEKDFIMEIILSYIDLS